MLLGRVVLPLKTVAWQVFHRPDFYTTETYDRPLTLTRQIVSFTALSATSTRVVEELTFETLPLLINNAVSGRVEAHEAVQQGLRSALGAGSVSPVPYPAYLPIASSEGVQDKRSLDSAVGWDWRSEALLPSPVFLVGTGGA